MIFINRLKQLGWKKLAIVGVSGFVAFFGVLSLVHSAFLPARVARNVASTLLSPPSPTVDCPDRIEHDANPAPIWIKGEEQRRISGEEEALIMTLCASPTPAEQTSPSSAGLAQKTTKTLTKQSGTNRPTTSGTPTSSTSISTPASTATPSPSSSTPATASSPTTKSKASPPILKNLGVAFAPYDAQTGRAGAFNFLALQNKPFIEFGSNGTEPTFTFNIAEDADVTAVADGYVYKVEHQSRYSDYSILASTEKDDLTWSIDYDHVINPTVSVGDKITAGQKLGIAGTHSDIGIGRVEIQIFGGDGTTRSYCPFTYFDANLITTYKEKLSKLMDDYEAYMFNTNIYNPDNYASSGHIGCLASTTAG